MYVLQRVGQAPFCGAAEKGVLILDSKKAVLVCVTGQHDCDRLIHAGKCIAQQRNVQLQVLCVQPTSKGVNGDCDEPGVSAANI